MDELQVGYIVERHLQDGDVVLFNRHPSLHKQSLMAHYVRVLPYKTFRLHPAVDSPYNADFDGDAMNIHSPQTEEARSEAKILLDVKKNIMSNKNNTNLIGCIDDAITGNYLLTKELVMNRNEAADLLYLSGINDFSRLPNKDKIDGKEVFSVLLPEDFNFIGKDKSGNDVKITNGKLTSGLMDKANLGQESGFIFRNFY